MVAEGSPIDRAGAEGFPAPSLWTGTALARRLLTDLGLAADLDKLPDQLSGGQRQRVALARALIHGPSVILADEPTGELDSVSSAEVIDLLLEAQEAVGATLIAVTHDPQVARRMNRTIGLKDGRLAGVEAGASGGMRVDA